MARRVKPHHDTKKTIEASDEIQSEGRSFFLPKFLVGNQVLATSTKYTIITTSVTITTVAQCIKSSSFYGGSTQACRKRRSLLLEAANQSNLNPTPVERFVHQQHLYTHIFVFNIALSYLDYLALKLHLKLDRHFRRDQRELIPLYLIHHDRLRRRTTIRAAYLDVQSRPP